MKWYVIPALIICGLNSMLASAIFCFSTFHLYTDKGTNPPTASSEKWISLVTAVVPFSIACMIFSLGGMYASMMKKKSWITGTILGVFIVCFGISIFFTITFSKQLGANDTEAEILYNKTIDEIENKHPDKLWIPEWLDNVQKQSKYCCGILTYRDYESFWPSSPTTIPRSCCRDPKNSTCPDDVTSIPFPHTASDFIKVDTGCMEEINQVTRRHVKESHQYCIMMTVFLAAATISFLIILVKRHLVGRDTESKIGSRKRHRSRWGRRAGAAGDGDEEGNQADGVANTQDGSNLEVSNNQLVIESIDSIETQPQPLNSADSILEIVDQKPSEPLKLDKEAPLKGLLKTQRSSTKISLPKTNAVFASIHQNHAKSSEASTGDDMTIGAGSMGRKEVFVVQETIEATLRPEEGPGNGVQISGSVDDVGDIVPDQEAGSPTGSPHRRRRKERRLGMSRRHHPKNSGSSTSP